MNFKEELRGLSFVEDIGVTMSEFIKYGQYQPLEDYEWHYLYCDNAAFDILGFNVKEYLDVSSMMERVSYIGESSLELSRSLKTVDWSDKYVGIISDLHLGNIKEVSKENTIFEVCIDESTISWIGDNMLVKVSGDQ